MFLILEPDGCCSRGH